MESNLELAWCAGFFDGEGSTSVLKARRDRYSYIRMGISQKDIRCLERFQRAVGFGKIYKSKTRDIHSWDCYKQSDVPIVMEKLWPYLSEVKRNQYEQKMELINNKKE